MNKQKRIRQEKGITLIALIITIVVLLILAVVTINAIQGDGILQYASNAADEYTAKADEEQETIDTLLGQIEGSLSEEEKITWTKTSEGDLVVGSTVVTSTGENFYVIGFKGDNNETVKLLAKDNIDLINFVQNVDADDVSFCEQSVAGYWGEGTDPYDIKEDIQPIPSTHTAAYAAYRYGEKLGVTGRLMLLSEAEILQTANGDILYGKNGKSSGTHLNYWLGTAQDTSLIKIVIGFDSMMTGWYCYSRDFDCGVRPVVEVLRTDISVE